MRWLVLIPLCTLFAGCTADDLPSTSREASGITSGPGQEASASQIPCQEPTPSPHDRLPKILRKSLPNNNWIGHDGLWVEVSWISTSPSDWKVDSGYAFKYATATLVDGRLSAGAGQPTLEVHRVDGSRGGTGGFGGYATASGALRHWWPTRLRVPTGGCWVVTEESGGTAVSFQVELP